MILKIISTALALSLTTFAIADDDIIDAPAVIQTSSIESSAIGSNADDMDDLLSVATDALADNRKNPNYSDPDTRQQRHAGLGFDASKSNGKSHNGECNGNGHKDHGNRRKKHGNGNGFGHCGDPSPSD
jgi:hypothetical protein